MRGRRMSRRRSYGRGRRVFSRRRGSAGRRRRSAGPLRVGFRM
nr:MAG: hypothetical protein [Microvirus sp.]